MFDKRLFNILDFKQILEKLSQFAVSAKTKLEIADILPSSEINEVKRMQQLTFEAYLVQNKYILNPIIQFDDIEEILNKAKAGATLQMGELLKVARLIRSARIAKKEINSTGDDVKGLKEITAPIFTDAELENSIGESIASENEMKDDASDQLRTLRRKIIITNGKLKDKLASYTRANDVSKFLQDNLVTVRMGRFVLPVKSECRSSIPGLIHDQSASGSTVFIEPFPIVELNNELKFLQMEEVREIERILANLSEGVANSYNSLNICQAQCIMLDIVFSKCNYSVSFSGTQPILNSKGHVNLINARHPLIAKEKIVPVSVKVGDDYKLLIITGPNTGGKTVCLKTVGLCCLMAASGLWIPCDENSTVSVFDSIFCDLGDEQSIAQSLSTFSAHIVNIVKITDNITPQSLVLMDELGAGTDPIEGAALAIGIVKYLELMGAVGIITTHYSELKEYALVSDKLENACMQFDEATLRPTYKLIIGLPGVSNALKIAGTLGINDFILKKATESIKPEKIQFEAIISNAGKAKSDALKALEEYQNLKNTLTSERAQLESERIKLNEKLERINSNAKAETKRVINNMLEQANDLMDEIKTKLKEADEESLRQARLLMPKLEDLKHYNEDITPSPAYEAIGENEIYVGQAVIVRSLNSQGIIISPLDRKGNVQVAVGSLKTHARLSDLAKPFIKAAPAKKKTVLISGEKTETLAQEVKVLGLTVAEAIEVLEPYILAAESGQIIRIVHGKGTGALGKGVQGFLKANSCISSYRYGRYGEGDNGVTIVEIK